MVQAKSPPPGPPPLQATVVPRGFLVTVEVPPPIWHSSCAFLTRLAMDLAFLPSFFSAATSGIGSDPSEAARLREASKPPCRNERRVQNRSVRSIETLPV